MDQRKVPWKAEWKAAGLDPGPLTPEEDALVQGLQKENQEFLQKHPWKGKPQGLPPRLRFQTLALPLVAAAAVLLFVTVPFSAPEPSGVGLERIKGAGDSRVEASIQVYRQGTSGAEKLAPKAVVRPGEVLQAAYQVPRNMQGALVSVDGSRNVTVHLAQGGQSTSLVAGTEHPLDFSYELDRAPGYEVFFLLVSPKRFDLEPIRQILKSRSWDSLKPDAFGSDIRFTVLPLTKELAP